MNRQSQGSLPVSKATVGFLQYKAAEGLSPTTLQSYQRDLKLWLIYAGDVPVHTLTTKLIQDFFVWLRTDYQPRRLSGKRHPLAAKTIHNFYVSLSAFFTWASRELNLPNPIKTVPLPSFKKPPSISGRFQQAETENTALALSTFDHDMSIQFPNKRPHNRQPWAISMVALSPWNRTTLRLAVPWIASLNTPAPK
jgi:integrase